MRTLEQLKKQVAVPKAGQEIPSEKKLRENEEIYESICIGHDSRITVYRNGYVVCMIGRHKTVFPITAAGSYTFGENEKNSRRQQETGGGGPGGIPEGRFSLEQEEWHLALYLAGEDRILKNMETGIRKKTLYTEREKKTAADEVFEKYWENQMMESALSVLTDREKRVVWECCILQKTEKEVGKEMGYSKSMISKMLTRARAKIRKSGVLTTGPERSPTTLEPRKKRQ
ncbi:MAG: sigma-70 family RNA polymerase sigma factor [Eubacteriales bacterium]|nr:sigma-70 family RNA polymerase sigma factor [Eubacteriales bacterium]